MTVEEKVQYIDDFFKRCIHDDGYDDLLEVATKMSEPDDKEPFIETAFILNRHYQCEYMLSGLVIDEVVSASVYLHYIYDNAKESLFEEQRRTCLPHDSTNGGK